MKRAERKIKKLIIKISAKDSFKNRLKKTDSTLHRGLVEAEG